MSSSKKLAILFVLFLVCFVLSLSLGKYPIPPLDIIKVFLSKIMHIERTWEMEIETVIFNIRLPRVLGAVLVGSALSASGAVYQGLFKNPMVSPDVLGTSQGAGFGAALGIYFSLGYFNTTLLSFTLGVVAVSVAYFISVKSRIDKTLSLVLSGMMVGSLFSSMISFLKLIADPDKVLPAITYWLMGSLSAIKDSDVIFASVPILIGIIPLLLLRWRINLLAMGEDEAIGMGVNTKLLRGIIVSCATLITAASVSISGMIGWVGLVIPHFSRLIIGYDYKYLLPCSILLGSSFLLIVDNFARMLTTTEIPLGILTSFIGAPLFLYLILTGGRRK